MLWISIAKWTYILFLKSMAMANKVWRCPKFNLWVRLVRLAMKLFCGDGENDFALSTRVTVFVSRQSYWPRLLPTPVFLFSSTPELIFLGVLFFGVSMRSPLHSNIVVALLDVASDNIHHSYKTISQYNIQGVFFREVPPRKVLSMELVPLNRIKPLSTLVPPKATRCQSC